MAASPDTISRSFGGAASPSSWAGSRCSFISDLDLLDLASKDNNNSNCIQIALCNHAVMSAPGTVTCLLYLLVSEQFNVQRATCNVVMVAWHAALIYDQFAHTVF